MMKRIALILGVMSLAFSGLPGCKPPARKEPAPLSKDGPVARAFAAPSLGPDGGFVERETFRGMVVLLDFWATWCGPCRSEIPDLKRLHDDFKYRGFSVVGLSVDQGSVEQVRPLVQRFELNYPVGLSNEEIQQNYGGIRAIPTKFLIDRAGKVRQHYLGVVPAAQLRADIEALLAEP